MMNFIIIIIVHIIIIIIFITIIIIIAVIIVRKQTISVQNSVYHLLKKLPNKQTHLCFLLSFCNKYKADYFCCYRSHYMVISVNEVILSYGMYIGYTQKPSELFIFPMFV